MADVSVPANPTGGSRSHAASSALGAYSPALDGLRLVAVAAVLAYHGGLSHAGGGFLGVSLFFTLSGFLLTSIILRERDRTSGLSLRTFWGRRYRRLLPAAYVCLAGIVLFGATVATHEQLQDLFGQVLASLAQIVNWYFIATDQSYTSLFAEPSPVQHYWSLAIEEQFFILMPLALWVVIRRGWSVRTIGLLLGAGALVSLGVGLLLAGRGAGIDRLYYGTDTRAAELLIGCVLAVLLYVRPLRGGLLQKRLLPVGGVVALAVAVIAWDRAQVTDRFLYEGGLFALSLTSAVLIASVVGGRGPVAFVLGQRPLAVLGRLSYGIYLIHWPVFLWLTPERTDLSGWPLFALRVGVTLAFATALYNLVEMPIRSRRVASTGSGLRWALIPAAGALVLAAFVVAEREVETELAFAREVSAPTVASVDEVVDVLVVADVEGVDRADALEELAADDDQLSVTVAEEFTCSATTPAAGATCDGWTDEWAELVRAGDPDVVVFDVTTWRGIPLGEASASGQAGESVDWLTSALAEGIDVLSSRGATVLWTTSPGDYEDAAEGRSDPFIVAAMAATARSSMARSVALPVEPAERVEAISPYQRSSATDDLERVLLIGDSVSRSVGDGLERWASADGRALVWSAGTGGCGLLTEGEVETWGVVGPEDEVCRSVPDNWEVQVDSFMPDRVVVLSSFFDLRPRRLDAWATARTLGDPEFEAYLVDAYESVFDIMSADGADVVWANAPCLGPEVDQPGHSPEERSRYNDVVLAELVAARPAVEVYDLDEVLCAEGEPRPDGTTGGLALRPDGIHLSVEGSRWVADTTAEVLLGLESG